MNSDMKIAVLKAGIVPKETIPELERWGLQIPEGVEIEDDLRNVLDNIRESVESRKTVEFRMTELDAYRDYAAGVAVGRLYYAVPDNSIPGTRKSKTTFIEVSYARTTAGVYLIPWTGEDIYDIMLDEGTYLKPVGDERVHFSDVSDLYYGEQKTFMVCTPVPRKKP